MNCTCVIDRLQCDDGICGPRTIMDGIAGLALAVALACLWQPGEVRAQSPGANATVGVPKVKFYEEDPNDPKGLRFDGSVTWSTERVASKSRQTRELAIRADVEIPGRKLGVTWLLESSSQPYMTHVFTVMFRVPSDFPAGGVMDVPGIMMKEEEDVRGLALRGYSVKVTDTFFMIGLSRYDPDREGNLRQLKRFPWFDIPIRYRNHRRAILAIEKGKPGERVFAEALAAWGQ